MTKKPKTLTIELSDEVFSKLSTVSEALNTSPQDLIIQWLDPITRFNQTVDVLDKVNSAIQAFLNTALLPDEMREKAKEILEKGEQSVGVIDALTRDVFKHRNLISDTVLCKPAASIHLSEKLSDISTQLQKLIDNFENVEKLNISEVSAFASKIISSGQEVLKVLEDGQFYMKHFTELAEKFKDDATRRIKAFEDKEEIWEALGENYGLKHHKVTTYKTISSLSTDRKRSGQLYP